MTSPQKPDYSLLLMLAAIFLFHSPFTSWWAQLGLPWYTMFLLWLFIIVMVAANHIGGRQADNTPGDLPTIRKATDDHSTPQQDAD